MDYRKIIKFGKNSHVISIPNRWINKYELKKGDTLNLEIIGDNLILSPQKEAIKEKRVITINITNETTRRKIKRELISAYENNFDTIIFSGKQISKFTKEITQLAESYIALEIVEMGETQLICKTYMRSEEVNIDRFAKRIDNSIKTMMKELLGEIDQKNKTTIEEQLQDIIHKEKNIDKITRMLRRVIRERLYKQKISSKDNPLELLRFWQFVANIERLSDNLEKIGVQQIKRKNYHKRKTEIEKIIKESLTCFNEVLKGFHKNSAEQAHITSNKLKKLGELIEQEQEGKQFFPILQYLYENKEFMIRINRLSY